MPKLEVSYTTEGIKQVAVMMEDDPQVYTLRFDFNEIVDAETTAECNLLAGLTYAQFVTARQKRGLLYALLKSAHPQVLLKEAGVLLGSDHDTFTKAMTLVCGPDESEEDMQKRLTPEPPAVPEPAPAV